MIIGQILPQTGESTGKFSFPVCCAACQQTKDMLSVGDVQGVDVHPQSRVLMFMFSCLVVVQILNLSSLEASSQLWKRRMDSHSWSVTITIVLNGSSLRHGQAWGESSSWTYLLSGQTTRKKPNLKLQEEKVSYKNSSATNQGVCLHVLTFLGSQERGLSLCLWPGDWQTLRPCQVCLGLDVLAGKLELLSETIIQFLSLVQLMAFI